MFDLVQKSSRSNNNHSSRHHNNHQENEERDEIVKRLFHLIYSELLFSPSHSDNSNKKNNDLKNNDYYFSSGMESIVSLFVNECLSQPPNPEKYPFIPLSFLSFLFSLSLKEKIVTKSFSLISSLKILINPS